MLPFDPVYHPPHADDATPAPPVKTLPEPLRICPRKKRPFLTFFRKA